MHTEISIPNRVSELVGQILIEAGFEVGSSGCGTVEFEREGETTLEEQGKLIGLMADALFKFEVCDEEATCPYCGNETETPEDCEVCWDLRTRGIC